MFTPSVSSAQSYQTEIPSVSGLKIDDGLIPVEYPSTPPHMTNVMSPVSPVASPMGSVVSPLGAVVSPLGAIATPVPTATSPPYYQEVAEPKSLMMAATPSSPPALAPDRSTKVVIRVDRAAIQKRIPASNSGASSAALKNTLISAVEGGKHKIVEQLLNRGVPPDTGTEKNAIHIAVKRQDADSLKMLLEFGADPDFLDRGERTAISYACFLREDIMQLLLEFGANPNLCAPKWMAMAWAIDANKLEQVQLLLRYGADPNGMSKNGETCLYYGAQRPCAPILHELLDWGADVNKKNSSGDTPLIGASRSRQEENIKLLLAHGALPDLSGATWAALPWIIDSGNGELVRYFLEQGGNPNGFSENGENHMVYAGSHAADCMHVLIEHGGDVNAKSKAGNTPLVAACSSRKFDVAKMLVAAGADPNLSSQNWAPLPWVIDSGDEELVRFMLQHGADPNGKSTNGWINMFYAVNKPFEKIVKLLLESGGNPDQKDVNGQTLLEFACRTGRPEMVKAVLGGGANPNQKGQQYPIYHCMNQPENLKLLLEASADLKLHPGLIELATCKNQIEVVKTLRQYGADVNEPHLNAYRALCTSIRENSPEIFQFLLEAGADPNLKGPSLPIEGALNKPRYLKPLLEAGADVKNVPGIMELAVWHNQVESVRALLDVAKVDINELRPSGHGAVTTAIRDNRIEMLSELITRKADLNIETCDGIPIIMASKLEDQKKLKMLLDAGVEVNKTERFRGYSALMQACAEGKMANVQLLLKHGADVEMTSKDGDSAMDIAAKRGHEEIVMALLEGME